MGMSMHDRYYEPEDGDDPEVFDDAVETYANELLLGECNPMENWGEGLSECGYDESEYPTPSHAPVEIVQKIIEYWQDRAYARATKYYEDHPEALYD